MKIKIEYEIEHCYQCPFKEKVYEQGFYGTECKFLPYHTIPQNNILEECPFRKKKEE